MSKKQMAEAARPAFEAFAQTKACPLLRHGDGYKNDRTQSFWSVWKEALGTMPPTHFDGTVDVELLRPGFEAFAMTEACPTVREGDGYRNARAQSFWTIWKAACGVPPAVAAGEQLPESGIEALMHRHDLIGVAGDNPNLEARLIAFARDAIAADRARLSEASGDEPEWWRRLHAAAESLEDSGATANAIDVRFIAGKLLAESGTMLGDLVGWIDPMSAANIKAGRSTKEWMWGEPEAGNVPVYLGGAARAAHGLAASRWRECLEQAHGLSDEHGEWIMVQLPAPTGGLSSAEQFALAVDVAIAERRAEPAFDDRLDTQAVESGGGLPPATISEMPDTHALQVVLTAVNEACTSLDQAQGGRCRRFLHIAQRVALNAGATPAKVVGWYLDADKVHLAKALTTPVEADHIALPPVVCVSRPFPTTDRCMVHFARDVSDAELLQVNFALRAELNNPGRLPGPDPLEEDAH